MATEDGELKMVKSMLRSVLISSKEGVLAAKLQRDYKEIVGDFIPYKKLGHPSFESFILSMPDVVRVERRGGDIILHGMADQSTAHIQKLVSKQKGRKLKKPIRRPRGGGSGSFFQQRPPGRGRPQPHRAPLLSTPSYHHRHGMPSFISPPPFNSHIAPLTPIQIQVGNSSSGTRTIVMKPNSMLTKAMAEANKERLINRPNQSNNQSQFEVPPRFRRRPDSSQGKPTYSTPVRRPQPQQNSEFAKIDNPQKYITDLSQYLRDNNLDMSFNTAVARGGYISSIQVKNNTFGSEDIFRTAVEAEGAAARKAISDLSIRESLGNQGKEDTCDSLPPEQRQVVKSRVVQILSTKKNGLWSTIIPHEYKEKFKEEPPADLLTMIKSWTDIARVEVAANTDRDIVYPVLQDENAKLVIPRDLLVSENEEGVVYVTYILDPGYFHAQREDSVIDKISEVLQTHCKSRSTVDSSTIKKGQFCAGLYSADGQWTRAEVCKIKDHGKVQLLFVDYGNIEDVRVGDIRWLSPDIAQYPCQAIRCSLYGVEPLQGQSEWSSAATEKFAQLVEDQALIGAVRWVTDELVPELDLYLKSDPGTSIGDKLVAAGLVRSTKPVSQDNDDDDLHPVEIVLPGDKEWDVHVTYISSSTESVMVRLVGEEFSDKLDAYQAKLQEAFRSNWSEAAIIEGPTYIAMDDDLYHRVRVISKEGSKVQCYFLDHGDTDELLVEQLHPLDPAINKMLPYQAVEVSLYGLEDVCTNITALERICELALGKTCVAEVIDREGIPAVVLYDTSGDNEININETILRTIEAEGGGIDSPRTISPSPVTSATATPTRVLSPVPITTTTTGGAVDEIIADSVYTAKQNKANDENNRSLERNMNEIRIIEEKRVEKPMSNIGDSSTSTKSVILDNQGAKPVQTVNGNSQCLDNENNVVSKLSAMNNDNKLSVDDIPLFQIPVGEYLDVHVNFIHDPSNFVCIPYGEMGKLNQLLIDMMKHYSLNDPEISKHDLELGKFYAGHKDGIWYRVRLSGFVGTDLVSVYEVDIGEYIVMEISEIRPLVEKFRCLPLMAFTATLGSITPESGDWFEAAKYKFIELARDRDLVGLVLGYNNDKNIVSLRLIDTSEDTCDLCIDEVLVKMGYAKLL